MKQNNYQYKVLKRKNNNTYLISKTFWTWITKKVKTTKNKKELLRIITKLTNNKIKTRAIESWIYNNHKPRIIQNNKISKINKCKQICIHNYKYLCPACNLYIKNIKNSPIPTIWRTHQRGKYYIYNKIWNEIVSHFKEGDKIGVFHPDISKTTNIDERQLRSWINSGMKPKIYNKEEFKFNNQNSYWLGLFLSDGHLRNNGSNLSYTYQSGSTNIFQGYWYPQLIQRFLPIFKHKKEKSLTYLIKHQDYWVLKTNISSFSPIFAKFLEKNKAILKRKNTKTSGYQKSLIQNNFINKESFFQGLFDGDGHISLDKRNGINLCLAIEYSFKHSSLINNFNLIPTACKNNKNKTLMYNPKLKKLKEIRFAPTSLIKLADQYTAQDITKQLNFLINSAKNSIRPDKVHQLIKVIERICSNNYGEHKNSLEIQREIKKEANKSNLKEKVNELKRRYPIKNNKYQPFRPEWADEFGSKRVWFQEAWKFFKNLENLKIMNYSKKLNFEEGVPTKFKLNE